MTADIWEMSFEFNTTRTIKLYIHINIQLGDVV